MEKYRKGDKVLYIGETSPHLVGLTGEVIYEDDDVVAIRWPSTETRVYKCNVKRIAYVPEGLFEL